MKKWIVIVAVQLLSGCGVGFYRDNLVKVSNKSYFELNEDLHYEMSMKNTFGDPLKHIVTIRKGRYEAISENQNGTFYTSDSDYNVLFLIYINHELSNHPHSGMHMGGIWIPKDKSLKIRPYLLFGKSITSLTNFEDTENIVDPVTNVTWAETNVEGFYPGLDENTGVVDSAVSGLVASLIIQGEIGKINMLPEIPTEVFGQNIMIKQDSE